MPDEPDRHAPPRNWWRARSACPGWPANRSPGRKHRGQAPSRSTPDRNPPVGYGRVGAAIGEILVAQGVPVVAIDHRRELVLSERTRGRTILFGDAARSDVIQNANPESARLLVVATPDPYQAAAIIDRVRAVNPSIVCFARAHGNKDRAYLRQHGADSVLVGEHELAFSLAHEALMNMGCDDDLAGNLIARFRQPDGDRSKAWSRV